MPADSPTVHSLSSPIWAPSGTVRRPEEVMAFTHSHQRRLLQAGLHGDQGGDGHPVGVRQVRPEGDSHGGGREHHEAIACLVSGTGVVSREQTCGGLWLRFRPRQPHDADVDEEARGDPPY